VFNYTGKALGIYMGVQPNDLPGQVCNGGRLYRQSIDGIHFVSPIEPNLLEIEGIVRGSGIFNEYDDVKIKMMW